MPRSVTEWIGKTDDSAPTTKCKQRIIERQNGCCALTGRPFTTKEKPEFDHKVPLWLGGRNCESNLQAIIGEAHKDKTRAEAKVRAKVMAANAKHLNIIDNPKPLQGAPMPTSRKAFERKQKAATKTALPPRSLFAPAGTLWLPGEARDHE